MKVRLDGEGLRLGWTVDLEGNGTRIEGYQAKSGAYVLCVTPTEEYGLWLVEAGMPVPHERRENVIEAYVSCWGADAWAKVAGHLEERFFVEVEA